MSFVGQIDAVTNKSSNGESYHQLIDSDLSESEINTNITSKNSRFAEIPVRTNTIFEYICEKLCFLRDQILLKIDRNYLLYKQTLDFARSEIKNHPDVAPIIFQKQPVNQEIAILTTLYWDKYRTEFSQVLKKHKKNAWKEDEVIQSADRLMKVAYAISILTLEDLFKFCIKNGSFGYARTLTRQDSYQYRTFFIVHKFITMFVEN